MKAFDLEKALAGEPVVLQNGYKAFIKFEVPSEYQTHRHSEIMGFFIDNNNCAKRISWNREGKYNSTLNDNFNIVGMYEEPRPTVTLTLPCPLKAVTVGQRAFYLDLNKQHEQVCSFLFQTDSTYHFNLLKNGGIFSTEEDAQAWLDAMKNARR
ncbi:pyruvate kinase [Pasteurella multocida]|uniref:pyruvate kinase n=1 Tax=Pasteurella multocida TaxID=747 RepID=UPI00230197AF|nr:pyruvate kinase [Pasteurella multocida]MDA5609292.1 pyruvate kinase [Pasteurella multocida subsp. multocida]MDA5616808.1 pyruvate kinase [Pasteurella multocida]MDA5626822.1 pyruvate kinase [Pasteurella multocida]